MLSNNNLFGDNQDPQLFLHENVLSDQVKWEALPPTLSRLTASDFAAKKKQQKIGKLLLSSRVECLDPLKVVFISMSEREVTIMRTRTLHTMSIQSASIGSDL